jgi:hypothetical protein
MTAERDRQSEKQCDPKISIEGGSETISKTAHRVNAKESIRINSESSAKVTIPRDLQSLKQPIGTEPTPGGMKMDLRDEHDEKASSSIQESWLLNSNAIF